MWNPCFVLNIFPFHASPAVDRAQCSQGKGGRFFWRGISGSSAPMGWNLNLDAVCNEWSNIIQAQAAGLA
jgi:hypothetical protein